ncbi:LuxR family transcriptional regulator (plasmid) [Arsenophonus nasoniae]|uniref:Bacterial regulatory protein, luxR family n=2 Tax=Arsenophonus nasoniae TaxID=638 RepID=A0A4P7L0M2_9GAMM|nr:LuxR family transcriptional regulator [Arsenophonus nasoniae]QBY45984.1 Bacterial regulatory protein, luxR family [Arsenophonus nasoniae]QBY46061.1 Bacterial regulatory protein, luxR family [Arsenophonus nasoniae]WGM08982.1 LuxR family transcriptional regulator [Arsenophonus nasoniae]WGM13660.1 LuxR family transcriptional regulator [Arsenophonus nasoniae]WGM18262.1 LuxR family transcriptional regulator [Arsenophonus nasoniae]
MKPEMIKLSLSANVPCGFSNSEGKIQTDAKMTDLLFKLIRTPEMKTLIEKVQTERSPFFVICHLPSDYNKAPKVWQFHFLPLFDEQKVYLGTFFYAHEFLFLSPLEYVDGMRPYAVTTEKPNDILSRREWQVLFFTMHRLSSKQIARKLGIFPSTVEFYLKAIYGKVNVHSACQLRTFCKSKGFERYIPVNLLPRSCVKSGQHVGGAA